MKNKIKKIAVALLAFTVGCACLTGCNVRQDTIRFGAAGVGGGYYAFATAYTQLANAEDAEMKFNIKSTAGSMANLRLLSEGYVDVAIAQADLATAAYYGTDEKGKSYQGYRVLAGLYTEACQIVVRKDSGIKSLDDLQGKTVSIGEAESGTERNALQILQVSGLASPITETVNLTYIEAAEKLKSGEIDAMFYTGGVQTNVIAELADSCEIALIPVDAKTVDKLKLAYSSYETCEIPANTYNGQTEQVATVGVKALLLASEKMSDETAEELTRQLFAHATEIEYATSLKEIADVNAAVDGVQIPFHPGAKAYYASQGISVDAQEN